MELLCPICLDIYKSPVVSSCCGNSFCKECLFKALSTSDSCPMCRAPLLSGIDTTTPNRALALILSNVTLNSPIVIDIPSNASSNLLEQRHGNDTHLYMNRMKNCLGFNYLIRNSSCWRSLIQKFSSFFNWILVHWNDIRCFFYFILFISFVLFLRVQENEFSSQQEKN